MSTTESGWPGLSASSPLLYTWNVPDGSGPPTRLRLRRGSAGFLLCHLALAFDETVEDLNGPVLDDWAYAYRAVRGYSTLSDHAGGIAEDLNATRHPLGKVGTFDTADHTKIEKLLEHYDGCLYWGGNYHARKDEMHFGVAKPLADVEKMARSLLDSVRGQIILKANPGQRAVILS